MSDYCSNVWWNDKVIQASEPILQNLFILLLLLFYFFRSPSDSLCLNGLMSWTLLDASRTSLIAMNKLWNCFQWMRL